VQEPDASEFAWVRGLPAGPGPAEKGALAGSLMRTAATLPNFSAGDALRESVKHMGLRPADALGDQSGRCRGAGDIWRLSLPTLVVRCARGANPTAGADTSRDVGWYGGTHIKSED
jgi:hypothetical protein